jgi:hypothetical protein
MEDMAGGGLSAHSSPASVNTRGASCDGAAAPPAAAPGP